jgi:hypothetical protein
MDSSTRTRMKRAKILATITDFRGARALNQKDRIDRNIFAGNHVLFKGAIVNPVICCPTIDPPLSIPELDVFCQAVRCHRYE